MSNETQVQEYRTIHGLSERRILPRLGKIRLGQKVKTKGGKIRPVSLPYFKFDPDSIASFPAILEIFSDPPQPTELDVLLPVDDPLIVFPQAYKCYGGSKLKCKGDGKTARRRVCKACLEAEPELARTDASAMRCREHRKAGEEMIEISCPCPLLAAGECSPVGSLMVMLPRISMGGVWQIDTHSPNIIVDINSALEFIRAVCGRISMIPLKLHRGQRATITPDGRPTTVHTVQLRFTGDVDEVRRLRAGEATAIAALVAAPQDDGDDLPPVEAEEAATTTSNGAPSVDEVLSEAAGSAPGATQGRPEPPAASSHGNAAAPAGPAPISIDAIVGAAEDQAMTDDLAAIMSAMQIDAPTLEATIAPEFDKRNLGAAPPKVQLRSIIGILKHEHERALAAGETPPPAQGEEPAAAPKTAEDIFG